MAEIKSVKELLEMSLDIPDYQRPYKWGIQNVEDLISDISNSIAEADRYRDHFKYRIGTVILHKNENGVYEIVDGQQRIITLTLLRKCIDPEFSCAILDLEFDNKVTQQNIQTNFTFLQEWFSLNQSSKEAFESAFSEILEVVVICVDKISEAFQLFDSQNTRGKELDPHDLLKAYHLREMKAYPYEMEHAVTKWEAKNTKEIRELFDLYLFPIWNWSRGFKSKPFTVKEIDTYKGITEAFGYSYARRAGKAMPYFQITEPFIAGKRYDNFAFEFRNSVEHWYPQNPSEGTFEQWKDGVDQFGNLCIIQRNVNSKFSNMSPEAKKSTFKDMISKGSLKLRIMSDLTETHGEKSASLYWKETAFKTHEDEMIKLLKEACGLGEME